MRVLARLPPGIRGDVSQAAGWAARVRRLIPDDDLDSRLGSRLRPLTSLDYRDPAQFAPGPVLVVGAANSGTDVALDAATAGHETYLAGRHPGQVPIDIDSRRGRRAVPVVMFVFRHVVTRRSPMGRKAYAQRLGRGVSLVHNKLADLDAAGITRIGAIEQVRDGHPVAGRGELPPVNTVVSCTGLRPDHRFLELPVFGADSRPRQRRGVSVVPGLYFLGLEFQFALASGQIQRLDRDARYLLRQLRAMSRVPAAA
jgi:putative flavoprotein involved in K+ transport